jgi:hypothetical protein
MCHKLLILFVSLAVLSPLFAIWCVYCNVNMRSQQERPEQKPEESASKQTASRHEKPTP